MMASFGNLTVRRVLHFLIIVFVCKLGPLILITLNRIAKLNRKAKTK